MAAEVATVLEASFQLAVELGILCAYTVNYALTGSRLGWVWSLAAPLPPAAALPPLRRLLDAVKSAA